MSLGPLYDAGYAAGRKDAADVIERLRSVIKEAWLSLESDCPGMAHRELSRALEQRGTSDD